MFSRVPIKRHCEPERVRLVNDAERSGGGEGDVWVLILVFPFPFLTIKLPSIVNDHKIEQKCTHSE